jgi:Fe-S oxidoreductase
VFRDELVNLLPHDQDALRLRAQTKTLGEFLADRCDHGWTPPRLDAKAFVHGHCHHNAIMSLGGERRVLDAMGLHVDAPATGCCGMAGAFGFEKDKYDVSIAVGERVLLPAVRAASADTLIVADGFSCREQIAQTTPRAALHLAEVLQLALHRAAWDPTTERPELAAARRRPRELVWRHDGHPGTLTQTTEPAHAQ